MARTETVTVIYWEIAGKKKFVSETSVRPDNKIVAVYSEDPDDARQYENEDAAQKIIGRIHNLHDRDFKTARIEVPVQRKKIWIRETDDELS